MVSVNPVRTGYNAIADEWIGIKPGTDGLFVAALIHELFKAQTIDVDYLVRYTNVPWLVIRDPGAADDGLFARDADGKPLAHDKASGKLVDALTAPLQPSLSGTFTLADGRKAVPVFQLLAERFLSAEYAPEKVEKETGVAADSIRRIAAELAHAAFKEEIVLDIPWTDWTGRRHDKMIGRPIGMHAMRGISAHSNGFHTCRILHILQILLGSIDCPGGFRYKAPYPEAGAALPQAARQAGRRQADAAAAGSAARLPDRARGPAGRCRGHAAAHRQGLQLGCAVLRARADAHGDRQRGQAAIPTPSTCCSCTWPTWAGTRR